MTIGDDTRLRDREQILRIRGESDEVVARAPGVDASPPRPVDRLHLTAKSPRLGLIVSNAPETDSTVDPVHFEKQNHVDAR